MAVLAVSATPGADKPRKPNGVCSGLQIGQLVSLKDEGSAFTISYFEPELPQSHKIIETGDNFIVVRDIAEVTETTIPLYAVKAVVKVKTKAK